MVTGSPGSGKTLSVNSVLQKLDQNDLKIISLNSNMLKTKKDVQNILAR
jgi:Cdc6-like AAA superfamily ATPase